MGDPGITEVDFPEFPPSGCPGLDGLLRVASQLWAQPELQESLEFAQHLQELQTFRRSLESNWRRSLTLSPATPLLQQLTPQWEECFGDFRRGCRKLESYLQQTHKSDLNRGCRLVHAAIIGIQQLAAQMQRQEYAWQQRCGPGLEGELRFLLEQGALTPSRIPTLLGPTLRQFRQLQQSLNSQQAGCHDPPVAAKLRECQLVLERFGQLAEKLQRPQAASSERQAWGQALLQAAQKLSQCQAELLQQLPPQIDTPEPGRFRLQAFQEVEDKVRLWQQQGCLSEDCLTLIRPFRQRVEKGQAQAAHDNKLAPELQQKIQRATLATQKALEDLTQALRQDNGRDVEAALASLQLAEELMEQVVKTETAP